MSASWPTASRSCSRSCTPGSVTGSTCTARPAPAPTSHGRNSAAGLCDGHAHRRPGAGRSAFHHSINYRSVVAHGAAHLVDEAEKHAALTALVEAVAPGRSEHTRPPSRKELAATAVLRLELAAVSLKTRTGDPRDDPQDLNLPHWAGVLPLHTTAGAPRPSADLPISVSTPTHVYEWTRPGDSTRPRERS